MNKLYEIENEIRLLIESSLDENGEIIGDDFSEKLENLRMEKLQKIKNIGIMIKNYRAEEQKFQNEIDNLIKRKNSIKRNTENLEKYLKFYGKNVSIDDPKVKISWRRSTSVEILDENRLPENYFRFTEKREPNKKTIGDALKLGIAVEGAKLQENDNLIIK